MTQSSPQPIQTVATQSARVSAGSIAASVRTVAFSLLVDRALSA
jgi:hypothetical protein